MSAGQWNANAVPARANIAAATRVRIVIVVSRSFG
jgi:hypothetical protein